MQRAWGSGGEAALGRAVEPIHDRFTVFCQGGQMRLPSKYPPLVTFLEYSPRSNSLNLIIWMFTKTFRD